MADSVELKTEKREGSGTRLAEKLRRKGLVPAVVYGHKEETVSLSVASDALHSAVRHGARVVDLRTDKGIEKAQIVELQWDYLGKAILHADFKRVSADERIEVEVPVELKGIAPGVSGGGLLDQPLHTLKIECPAIAVPDSIRVSIADLQLGAAIHIRELKLPENVRALGDPEAIVVHVLAPQAEPETAAEAAVAEPEVIGRKKEEEGEEEK